MANDGLTRFYCACGQRLKAPPSQGGQKHRCPKCGGWVDVPLTLEIAETVRNEPPPTVTVFAPQLHVEITPPYAEAPRVDQGSMPLRFGSKRSPHKTISRLMLVFTVGWLFVLFCTMLFCASFAADKKTGHVDAPGVLGFLISFAIFAFFETFAYAVAMVFLWVIRINLKD